MLIYKEKVKGKLILRGENNNLYDESMWFWCNFGVLIMWINIFFVCSFKFRRGRYWKCNLVVIIRWNIKFVYNFFICFILIL